MPVWLEKLIPIIGLLVAVGFVMRRLPKVDLGHSEAFKRRRVLNWVPLGLTYAFLYFGRYNLSAIAGELDKAGILTRAVFNEIDGVGAWVYGLGFLINGPLTDRFGGRVTMLLATSGSAVVNVAMALTVTGVKADGDAESLRGSLMLLNAVNMYFQSFGAVSIVKVNAPWFHVRERGVLGGLFGVLISLGLYFSYDWSLMLARSFSYEVAFWIPGATLFACVFVTLFLVRDTPAAAGFEDFDTGDASSGQVGTLSLWEVLTRMFSQRVIWVIVAIEFCSGFLRNAVMQWYIIFAKQTGQMTQFVAANWGLANCVAGILGGVFAGTISDKIFHSRRGPVSSILYGMLFVGSGFAIALLTSPWLGWVVSFMMLAVIGVHGMLSGTASMDFAGKRNVGIAVGLIDGMVYLGTGLQAMVYGSILPSGDAAKDPAAWSNWPLAMLPVAGAGVWMAARLWNARPVTRAKQMPHFEATDSAKA